MTGSVHLFSCNSALVPLSALGSIDTKLIIFQFYKSVSITSKNTLCNWERQMWYNSQSDFKIDKKVKLSPISISFDYKGPRIFKC